MIVQNNGKDLPIDTLLHPWRLQSASAPLCKPYILQDCVLLGCCSFADRYQRLGGSRFLHHVGTFFVVVVVVVVVVVIIIIIFMQGIYTHIPETNYVPTEYGVAAILLFLFMVLISLVSVLNLLYFYISTFRSMCAVSNMAVFCSSLTSWFPGMLLTYFPNVF